MHFKINNLEVFANLAGAKNLKTFSRDFCEAFIAAGYIDDEPYNYGSNVMDAIGKFPIADIVKVLRHYLNLPYISAALFGAFCSLILMGEGNCPECGGSMELHESDGKTIDINGTPNWIASYRVYRCDCCGHKERFNNTSDCSEYDSEDKN